MDKLKDVDVIERHVVCHDHVAAMEKELNDRMTAREAVYQPEDTFNEPCEQCGQDGWNAYLVLAGPGLIWLFPKAH
jgi:hypothetical protein